MYCMISENTRVLLDASKREFEVKSMLLRYISVLFLALKSCSHPLNGEITSLGLKVERKNTNQCLSALIMEN